MTISIVIAGLSPAVQRTWTVPGFAEGRVNRIRDVEVHPSGKPVNTARAARALGAAVTVCCPVGGLPGALWRDMLDAGGGIAVRAVAVAAPTRICATLIDAPTGRVTELVEEAGALSPEELDRWIRETADAAAHADILVLAGNLPPGTPANAYARVVDACRRNGLVTVADTSGPAAAAVVTAGVDILKMNRDEWAATEPLPGARPQRLVITDGPGEIEVREAGRAARLRPPRVDAVNTTGCGDAFTAGMALAWRSSGDLAEAATYGAACGSAAALTRVPGGFDPADAKRLRDRVSPVAPA